VVVEGAEGYHVKSALAPEAVTDADGVAAYHRPEGVLRLGPSIAPGTSLDGGTVVDVAPTVLHGLGEPIPAAAAQGRVLTEIFDPESPPATRAISRQEFGSSAGSTDGPDTDEAVEERLRGLGYL